MTSAKDPQQASDLTAQELRQAEELDRQRAASDQAGNEARNAEAAVAQQAWFSRLRSDGGGAK